MQKRGSILSKLTTPLLIFAGLWLATAGPGLAQDVDILRYDIADTVDTMVDKLAAGSKQGRMTLEALDPGARAALSEINSGRDFQHTTFSARTQVTAMYNMAEAAEPGEGNRFIAKLHWQMSKTSPQLRLDPGLQAISSEFTSEDLDRPLRFAEARNMAPSSLLRPLPANLEAAVDLLARTMSPGNLGSVTTKMQRHLRFNAPGDTAQRVTDKAILAAGSRKEALHQIVNAHTPPPKVQQAMRKLMLDVASQNAALGMDAEFGNVLRNLGEERLPSELSKINEIGDTLQSRQAQSRAVSGGTAVSRPPIGAAAQAAVAEIMAQGGVEALANSGSGPSSPGGPSYESNRRAHATYGRNAFDTGVPRTYSRAIRSPRAARGIAIGAELAMPQTNPSAAFWVPAGEDDRFGRLAVTMPGSDRMAVTRFLFADSFEAAISTLWGDHGTEGAYRPGQLNIVMSMDPESKVVRDRQEHILSDAEKKMEALRLRALNATQAERLALMLEGLELAAEVEEQMQRLPRGIVIHPALHGRELAWSVARVDFWFNDLERMGTEAEKISGSALPVSLASKMSGRAGTWQFFEKDGRIDVSKTSDQTNKLRVLSPGPEHFGVTLFAFSDVRPTAAAEQVEEGVWLLPDEQNLAQPLLDWALNNHPDFMRLNDYSEALSVLRWLDRAKARLVILDHDGQPGRIATPDRVSVGEVAPRAGN